MKYIIVIILTVQLGALTGCNRYSLTFNEQAVYTPPSLFSAYDIGDEALRNCVAQTIADTRITQAKDLHGLNCSTAGITNLKGLEIFASLETLILVGNTITDLKPLLSMPSLITVDLSDNPSLNCTGISYLMTQGTRVTPPQHCRDSITDAGKVSS